MNWRTAFLRQVGSDNRVRSLLSREGIDACHRLHYLQMVTEKLAKAFLARNDMAETPELTHRAFVTLLQTLKGRPDIRKKLGYPNAQIFRQFINSMLELAEKIERLAPSLAGTTQPNPEYPWHDAVTNDIVAPADFKFELFDPRLPRMIKLENLIVSLIEFMK